MTDNSDEDTASVKDMIRDLRNDLSNLVTERFDETFGVQIDQNLMLRNVSKMLNEIQDKPITKETGNDQNYEKINSLNKMLISLEKTLQEHGKHDCIKKINSLENRLEKQELLIKLLEEKLSVQQHTKNELKSRIDLLEKKLADQEEKTVKNIENKYGLKQNATDSARFANKLEYLEKYLGEVRNTVNNVQNKVIKFGENYDKSNSKSFEDQLDTFKEQFRHVSMTLDTLIEFSPINSAFKYLDVKLSNVDGEYSNWDSSFGSLECLEFVCQWKFIYFFEEKDEGKRKTVVEEGKKDLTIRRVNRFTRMAPWLVNISGKYKYLKHILYKAYYTNMTVDEFNYYRQLLDFHLDDANVNNKIIRILIQKRSDFEFQHNLTWIPKPERLSGELKGDSKS